MFDIPPGPAYLIQRLPSFLTPPGCVFIARYVIKAFLEVQVPAWLLVLSLWLSFPIALTVTTLHRNYSNRKEAESLGAVIPPAVADKWPGGFETLVALVDNFKRGYPGEQFVKWAATYGNTFNLNVMFENRTFTCDPEYIKAILSTQFESFDKGPVVRTQFRRLLGDGVFNADGEMWKFHRAMTRPFFSKERISHVDIFDRHANAVITQLKTRLREGFPVDFQDVVSRFTLDSATEFLFGTDVCSLSAGLSYPERSSAFPDSPTHLNNDSHPANLFANAFLNAQSVTALRSRWGVNWPLKEFWCDNCKKPMRIVDSFINPILAEAIAKKRAEGGVNADVLKSGREAKEGETLLDHLANYTEDPKLLKDEILNIMIAGRDTTAATLTYAIYFLAEHPHVLKRLREEILTHLGNSQRPTFEQLREMKYLRAVINETLRLYPAVPFNIRFTTKPTLWPSKTPGGKPFYIPANTKVPYSVFLMHRRTDLWGPDAEEFDPDRFIDERLHKYLIPNPFIFLPFNAGPRICLGQQFAYNEMSFMLVRLFQNFSNVSLAPEAQPVESHPPASWANATGRQAIEKIWPRTHLTMYAQDGVWVRMEEVQDGERA